MAKYQKLSDEMFQNMMSSDKGIREARFAVCYGRWVNGESITDGHYVNWPDYRSEWEISEEQRGVAKERFEQRKLETVKYCSQKGVLTWHSMGMDYEPSIEDGIGNHRIRTTFKDKTGHVWFIEIHPSRNEMGDACDSLGWWGEIYDVSGNNASQLAYEKERERLLEKYGNWWRVPTNERVYSPACSYERIECGDAYTYKNVLSWVNNRFKTDYKVLFLERYFLNSDDIISEC